MNVAPWVLTDKDLKWLRSMRISAGTLCPTCGGTGYVADRVTCRECKKVGILAYVHPTPEDTNDAA
jgi:hypothetical protein